MIPYASRTGTRRNLAALERAGWRLIISPLNLVRPCLGYALDNGAWSAYTSGGAFDEVLFLAAYEQIGRGADFVVLPDIVAGGVASLAFSLDWRERLGIAVCPQLLAVQDGMDLRAIAQLVGPCLGIFVGGSTEWKLASLQALGSISKERGAYLHVGRVNTVRRIKLCAGAGAHSFDGSSVSRFAVNLPKLDNARHQRAFVWV